MQRDFAGWTCIGGFFSKRAIQRCVALLVLAPGAKIFGVEVNAGQMRAAAAYSRAHGGFALVIEQGDRLLFEDYKNAATERHRIYSGTKGFWAVTAMIALGEGIFSLDERVAETVTEWEGDGRKSRIRVRQLLDFTAGIEPGFFLHGDLADRNAAALRLKAVAEPGARFIYGPGQLQIFGEFFRRKLAARGRAPAEYMHAKVLAPLGIGGVEFKKDALGNPLLAAGFRLSAREWARLGTTILHRGSYRGRRIVSAGLLDQLFRPSGANGAFGIAFWLNGESRSGSGRNPDIEDLLELKWHQANWNGVSICRAAPSDMIVSIGSGYQRMYVIPSLDLVVVRQSAGGKFSDCEFLRLLLGR